MSLFNPAIRRLEEGGAVTLARAPEGYDAFVVAELTRALARAGEERAVTLVVVARDGLRAQSFIDALAFAAPRSRRCICRRGIASPTTESRPARRYPPARDGAGAARPFERVPNVRGS